jgi:chorismate dehydratase
MVSLNLRKNTLLKQKIRVGAVNYLNTKPLIYGFEQGAMENELSLALDYPAALAQKLTYNDVDIALLPIAVLAKVDGYFFVGNHCISCDGPVASVGVYSQVPLQQVTTLFLDYQSRTSVQLLKILLRHYWQVSPKLEPAYPGYEKYIQGTTAGLVIGDRAFAQKALTAYEYDLGAAWKNFTGLPFVFAAWISKLQQSTTFATAFDAAQNIGLQQIDTIVSKHQLAHYDLKTYYTKNIGYELNAKKMEAIQLFLTHCKSLK